MPIWTYADIALDPKSKMDEAGSRCLFCLAQLDTLNLDVDSGSFSIINFCPKCGWWIYIARCYPDGPASRTIQTKAAVSILKQLDLADIRMPIEEVRRFLLARYQSRFDMHPRLFEETVGSVFKDLGFSTEVTGYSNDGGIDIIMRDSKDTIGVQVKRYINTIQVEQIRSLAGALVLGGLTKGAFVTTSAFTAGASTVVKRYTSKGISIELYDSTKFLEALSIAQKPAIKTEDDLPFDLAELLLNHTTVIDEFPYYRSGDDYLFDF